MNIKEITPEIINDAIFNSEGIIILTFYARWCEPCKEQFTLLDTIVNEGEHNIKVYRVDYEKYKDLSKRFEVISLPILIFFKEGKEKARFSGSQTKEQIEIILSTIN